MDPLTEGIQTRRKLPATYIKMVCGHDFYKLVSVCLKMLFRKSTRKRFALLVMAFMFMMSFNTGSYVKKFHASETQKKALLDEKAFKLFFLRMNTRNNCALFLHRHKKPLDGFGVSVIDNAFLYQNNLYIHVYPASKTSSIEAENDLAPIKSLYSVLEMAPLIEDFFSNDTATAYDLKAWNIYIDYNGTRLDKNSIMDREEDLQRDLKDFADAIRGNIKGRRFEAFNRIKNRIIDNMKRIAPGPQNGPNPYLSRLQSIIPLNLLYILTHIRNDNTTDIMDLPDTVSYGNDGRLTVFKDYLKVPEPGDVKISYGDLYEIFPRYLPLYTPDLLTSRWNWLLYQQIRLKNDFMNYIDRLHFSGNYLFSYEKSHIIKDKVKKINTDIRANHIFFYLTDLSMGIIFPFMMSLFAFIHLKTEIAFLLMSKNRIREILFIFWLLPVSLMLVIKVGVVAIYWFYLYINGFDILAFLALPLTIMFVVAAVVFLPVNRWCFNQFTGDSLSLYDLHKGR